MGSSEARGTAEPASGTAEPPRRRLFIFRLSNAVARLILRLLMTRIVVEGRGHVPDRPGVILASNHLSILDPVILTLVIDDTVRRRVRYMAKAEALNWPFFGLLLHHYGGFAVRRGTPDREAYRTARNVLAEGDWLGLAPEGTRSRTGTLGEPKSGVALLAMRSGAIVLPVGIWGTERLWPVGARFPRFRTTVTIRLGEPYEPSSVRPADEADEATATESRARRRESVDAVSEDLMRRIAALLPEQYRGRFG